MTVTTWLSPNDWRMGIADGRDVLIVAGGIGLAPLRPVVLTAMDQRARLLRGLTRPGRRP
jgi:NAD(P)H-flavin reductase